MTSTPLISIALCTYNGKKYLKEQLETLVNQTYPNIEIIAVDDCSTDGTRELLETYRIFPQVQIYYNDQNLGFLKNFEKAILLSSGKYIALADQDDVWELNKIEVLQQAIESYALVYSDSLYIDSDGNSLNTKLSDFRNPIMQNDPFVLDSESGIWIAGHATLFDRQLIQLSVPFNQFVNHDTWIVSVALFNGGIKYIPNILTKYRQHEDNQVGGVGFSIRRTQKHKSNLTDREQLKGKLEMLYTITPEAEIEFKTYLKAMIELEKSYCLVNRIKIVLLRCKYAKRIYAPRKRNIFRIYFRILKSF